jgi:hypothetical protein
VATAPPPSAISRWVLRLGHQHVLVHELPDRGHRPAVVQPDAAAEHLGQRVQVGHVHRVAGLQAGHHRGCVLRRGADDPDRRRPALERDAQAADQPASGHRGHGDGQAGDLLGQLEADGALPGDHVRVVERVHEAEPALALDPLGHLGRVVIGRPGDDRLGAAGPDRAQLYRVDRLGHADRGRDPEPPGDVGHRRAVVAPRAGDHPAAALVR